MSPGRTMVILADRGSGKLLCAIVRKFSKTLTFAAFRGLAHQTHRLWRVRWRVQETGERERSEPTEPSRCAIHACSSHGQDPKRPELTAGAHVCPTLGSGSAVANGKRA